MMVNVLRTMKGSELATGIQDLPAPFAHALIEGGYAERVETATVEAPENTARVTRRRRPRKRYVPKH